MTLRGVVFFRSVYFGTYAHCKTLYSDVIQPVTNAEKSLVHLCSAASAGKFTVHFTRVSETDVVLVLGA